jgi:cation diffusion facilitator CzcD-associated flavoprotein CzcO
MDDRKTDDAVLDVAIIGAGFGGIAMARALAREGGSSFRVFEKAEAIGGTWRDNTYPGAACDVPSHLYSLSDAPNPGWTRLFPAQAEIRDYLDALAAPLLADGSIRTGFRLVRAHWDDGGAAWRLESAAGRQVQARRLVLALGGLHHPAWPDLPGLEAFGGASFHTARWNHDVDLAGKRVAVIGTGASAIQVVPRIVRRCEQLHVVQRTPPWVLPRPDRALAPALRRAFTRWPLLRLALRGAIFAWLEAVAYGLFAPRTAFWARALARRHLRRQVADASLRERLTPRYPIGCKRVLVSSDWYPALQAPNCELVDTAIQRVEPAGLRLADGRLLEADVVIHATGFRPMDVLNEVEIRGRDGRRLAEDWRERPVAHLGIGVHGYPNLHFLLGPNTALGHNSVLYMIESQVRHVLALRRECARRGARAVEPDAAAQAAFIEALDRRFTGTAWAGGCRSWYLDARGRNLALWVGSALAYRRRTRAVRGDEYLFT